MSNELNREFVGITDAAMDDLRKRIGVKIGRTLEPWCYEATRDNIRHYAHGIGDDNPLWCDPDYAASSPYGGIVAPPSFIFACSRIISGYVGGLPGVHAMWAGCDFNWMKPDGGCDIHVNVCVMNTVETPEEGGFVGDKMLNPDCEI